MTTRESGNRVLSIEEIAKNLNDAGIPPDFGDENSRILIKMWRTLAQGEPVIQEMTTNVAAELEISFETIDAFLRQITERDSDDNIIGLMGLSLNQGWAHRLTLGQREFRTWCAWDTLFLPAMLGETAVIESESPVTGAPVRLTVTPNGVRSASPEGAVVSIAIIDTEIHDVPSVEAIWSNFCHQVFFFASMDEAREWAQGKTHVQLLSVEDAYQVGRLAFSNLRKYAA